MFEAVVSDVGNGMLEARFPDLDIVTQGSDMTDVAFMAQDLLENHLVVALQRGEDVPAPTFGNDVEENGYRMAIVVDCDADTPQEETMTVNEAADVLDVSAARIRAMIRDGILKSRKVGNIHMVDAQSVMDRYNEPVRVGRPRKELAIA